MTPPEINVREVLIWFGGTLLQALHLRMDRRLVQTVLDLLLVMVMHRHRNQSFLLSERLVDFELTLVTTWLISQHFLGLLPADAVCRA